MISEKIETETKEVLILNAAREIFAKKGYHQARVSEIAQQAGVGKGTVYRYFDNKSGLFVSLVEDIAERILGWVEQALRESDDPEKQLEIIVLAHLKLFDENPEVVDIIVNEGLERTGIKEYEVVTRWDKYLDVVRDILRRGIEQGCFKQLSVERGTWIIISAIWGLLRNAVTFGLTDLNTAYRDEFFNILKKGVCRSADENS